MLEKNYSKLGNGQRDAWVFFWSSAWRAPVNGSPSTWPSYSSVGAGLADGVLFGRDAHNYSPVGIVLYDPVMHLLV